MRSQEDLVAEIKRLLEIQQLHQAAFRLIDASAAALQIATLRWVLLETDSTPCYLPKTQESKWKQNPPK